MTPSEYCRVRAPLQRTSKVYRPAGRVVTARLSRFLTAGEATTKSPGVAERERAIPCERGQQVRLEAAPADAPRGAEPALGRCLSRTASVA